MIVGRDVTIGINARCLDAPIPDVSINVVRQIRRSKDNTDPEDASEEQDQNQSRARTAGTKDQPDNYQIKRTLNQGKLDEPDDIRHASGMEADAVEYEQDNTNACEQEIRDD